MFEDGRQVQGKGTDNNQFDKNYILFGTNGSVKSFLTSAHRGPSTNCILQLINIYRYIQPSRRTTQQN